MLLRPTIWRVSLELLLALVLVCLLPTRARASTPGGPALSPGNPATQVPRVNDGPGLKFSKNSVFHGGAALAIGFDSNVFSEERNVRVRNGEGATRRPVRAAYGMPAVWLSIGNRPLRQGLLDSPPKKTQRKVDYNLGVLAGWRLYMDGRPQVWQASKLNLGVNARFIFAPGRRFSVALEDDMYRLGEPTNFEAGREFNFNRIDNSAALRFTIRPSGGRLSIDVAYRNDLLYFQRAQFYRSDRLVNGVETETKYRFRDRSAFAVRYSFHYTYYFCCTELGSGRNEDSHAHRAYAGYVGQLGKKVVLDVFAGWAWLLYRQDPNGPDHKNFVGYASLGYFPTARTQLALRVGRDARDSVFGNYMTDVGGTLAANHTFRWNMRLDAGIGVWGRRYAGLPIPGQDIDTSEIIDYRSANGFVRRDTLISFNLQLEQPFGKYFVLAARYSAAADLTDFAVIYPADSFVTDTDVFENPARFNRHLAMIIAAVRY